MKTLSIKDKYILLLAGLESIWGASAFFLHISFPVSALIFVMIMVMLLCIYLMAENKRLGELSSGQLGEFQRGFDFLNKNIPGILCRWTHHADGRISFSYISDDCSKLFSLIEKPASLDFINMPDHDKEKLKTCLKKAIDTGSDWQLECSAVVDSISMPCSLGARIIHGDNGKKAFDCILVSDMDNRNSERELSEAKSVFMDVLDNMPVLINAFDEKGNVMLWNKEMEELTGYSREEVVNNPEILKKILPENSLISGFLNGSPNKKDLNGIQSEIICKDGSAKTIKWANVSSNVPIPGWRSWIVGFDATMEKAAEEVLWRRDLLLAAAAQTAGILLSSGGTEESIAQVFGLIGPALEADRVYLFENKVSPNDKEHFASYVQGWSYYGIKPLDQFPSLKNFSYGEGFSRWYRELSNGNPIKGSINKFPEAERSFLAEHQILSILILPVFINKKFWGIIGFDDCHMERIWTDNEESILSVVGASAASFIMRQRAEEKLAEEKIKAERSAFRANAATKAKSEFLANLSHDIRTPLNGIIGMAQLLAKTELNPRQKQSLSDLRESAEFLMAMISDVLDLSKVEAGKLDLESIAFDLHAVLSTLCESMKFQAEKKGLAFKFNFRNNSDSEFVSGDSVRLRQVIMNLLGNAIKFTEKGQVELIVEMSKKPDSLEMTSVSVSVKDSGIGIPSDKLNIIFEKFMQADSSTSRKFGGTGLGLAICKNIVEKMGGRIDVSSEPGLGSTFSFRISMPSVKSMNTDLSRQNTEPLPLVWKRAPLILLADDSGINRRIAVAFLSDCGCSVDEAENGLTALDAFQNKNYDLVFMDLQMPEMDGLSATLKIRELETIRNSRVPIIAMTANALQTERKHCIASGMDEYLTKPVHEEDIHKVLREALRHLLKNSESIPSERKDENSSYPSESDIVYFNPEEALGALGSNKKLFLQLLRLYLEETPTRIRELRDAVMSGNFEAASKSAHRIKGESASTGLVEIAKLSALIEKTARDAIDKNALYEQLLLIEKAFPETSVRIRNYVSSNPV